MILHLKLSSVILPLFCPLGDDLNTMLYLMLYWCLSYIEVIQINLQRKIMSLHPTSFKFLSLSVGFLLVILFTFPFLAWCTIFGWWWFMLKCKSRRNVQANFSDWWLWYLLWIFPQMNVTSDKSLMISLTSDWQWFCAVRQQAIT